MGEAKTRRVVWIGSALGAVLLIVGGVALKGYLLRRSIQAGPAAHTFTVFELTAPRVSGATNAPTRGDPGPRFLGQVVEVTGILRLGPGAQTSFVVEARQPVKLEDGGGFTTKIYARTDLPSGVWPADGSVVRVRGLGEVDVKGAFFLSDAIFVEPGK